MHREIMGIQIERREDAAVNVQNLLTKHGEIIRTRLGLHDTGSHGLIVLDFVENAADEIGELKKELETYKGVAIQTMTF